MNAGVGDRIEYNVCYDNGVGIDFYQYLLYCENNKVTNNLFFGRRDNQLSVLILSQALNYVPSAFDSNKYFNVLNTEPFRVINGSVATDYDFLEWKKFVDSDSQSESVTNKNFYNSKLFTNMSDDSVTILLNNSIGYKDIYLNNIYGSVTLSPWSSIILYGNTDINNQAELNASGEMLKLGPDENGWYNLTGENLYEDVTITAPPGYGISLEADGNYANSISLKSSGGKVDEIIFVEFTGDADRMYNGYITNVSSGVSLNRRISNITK